METKALEVVQPAELVTHDFMPVMSIEAAIELRENIVKFVAKIMQKGQDYGEIPGSKGKPTLLKPGAEKLCSFFGLEPEFTVLDEVSDLTGANNPNGEPFYYIRYHCRLKRNGVTRGVGEGSCNSWESKYRYRQANRRCPVCGAEAIIKGKDEYGGGWLCFAKKGGCGAKFNEDHPGIVDQAIGRVLNPDVADAVNTIQKMAQKRALIPATLLATSGSEYFTQDLEDAPDAQPDAQPSAQRNTPEQQRALAERRIRETKEARGDGQTGAVESPRNVDPSTQAAPNVPGPLKAIYDSIVEGKKGAVRQAFDFMKAQLLAASPDKGEAEYHRIVGFYDAKYPGVKVAGVYWECILELWNSGEAFRNAVSQATGYQATDADLPFEDEPTPAEVAK
jgi:hypothetical protein